MYSEMTVSSGSEQYAVKFTVEGNIAIGDQLTNVNYGKFSTFDRDNDRSQEYNCAKQCGAGFWYRYCDFPVPNINEPDNYESGYCAGFGWFDNQYTLLETLKETRLYLLC